LLGCDLEWATGSSVGAAAADPPVLAAGAAADDDDASNSEESDAPGRAMHGAAARAPAPAEPNGGNDTNDAGGGADGGGGGGEDGGGGGGAEGGGGGDGAEGGGGGGADAAAEDGDSIVLDVGDFTSWEPDTSQYVDYDKIQFPTDPMLSICSVRSYFAVAMILFYERDLREKHTRTWDCLSAAWKATFHQDLSSRALEKWPEDGPHGFNATKSAWLA
jgi:hypothetical protein